ncbi:M23 family metallopeptidase [Candidatus Poriferisodalis sp.]|uniref:M23 family metallopeptidase n=1 Tax=Candidatus Poriferisodalis sp. TaxID=3101277 RepID=UPI003B016BAD
MNAFWHDMRRWARRPWRALAAVMLACTIAFAGTPSVQATDLSIEVPSPNLHLNACFPEPPLPALPHLGPAIENALIYDDWLATVITTVQGCEPLRVPLFGELRMPLADPVMTSAFGNRYHPLRRRWLPHTGVDLVDRERRWRVPVLASGKGTVIATGDFAAYGRTIVIDHGARVATMYTHLSSISVRDGDTVDAGERIGRLGSTGAVTGPHLQFELRLGGAAVDPLDYVAPWSQPPGGHW